MALQALVRGWHQTQRRPGWLRAARPREHRPDGTGLALGLGVKTTCGSKAFVVRSLSRIKFSFMAAARPFVESVRGISHRVPSQNPLLPPSPARLV